MKKLILICGVLLFGNNLHAELIKESEEDRKLLALGILDTDYRYKNIEKANEYFRVQSNETAKSLPTQVDSFSEISSTMITPYGAFYSYRFLSNLDASQRREVIKDIKTESNFKDLCSSFFDSKYQVVNNQTIKVNYMDRDYKDIVVFNLDPKKCNVN